MEIEKGYLEYWKSQFPEFIDKLSDYQKELLNNQSPDDIIVLSENSLRNRLHDLQEYEEYKRMGHPEKSKIYKEQMNALDNHINKHLLYCGIGHFIGWLLIAIGIANLFSSASVATDWFFIIGGVIVYITTIVLFGTKQSLSKGLLLTEEKLTKEESRRELWVVRYFTSLVVYIPLIALALILVSFYFMDRHEPISYILGSIGGILIATVIMVICITGKDVKKNVKRII